VVRVQDHQHRRVRAAPPDAGRLRPPVQQDAEAPRVRVVPRRLIHLVTGRFQPGDVLDADLLIPLRGQEPGPIQDRQASAERCQPGHEVDQALALALQLPVQPAYLVVLAVSVVVAALGAAELVACQQHRRAAGQQQGRQHVLELPGAERVDLGVVGRAFRAAVPAFVVAVAVVVVLAVRLVVLLVVGGPIVQSEAVMRRQEVDGRPGRPATTVEEVAAAGEPDRHVRDLAGVPLPVCPHGVAVTVVPLRPTRREAAHLIAAGAAIPRFRDHLDLAQHRVLAHCAEEAAFLVEPVAFAGQDGAEVEAEPIHVHLRHPVAQAVHHQLDDARVRQVERVSGAGVVDVIAFLVGQQAVVGPVSPW